MKTKLSIILLFLSLTVFGQFQQSELNKGLIFHAPLDEWNGSRDLVSGTVGTATAVTPVLDKSGSGRRWLEYNGTSSYTALPTIPAFGTSDFTVIVKIKFKHLVMNPIIGGVVGSFCMRINASGFIQVLQGAGATAVISSSAPVVNEWCTVTYKRAAGVGTVNINGADVGSATDVLNYGVPTQLGTVPASVQFGNVDISMCRIFNYALTAQQIINYSKPEYPIEWVDSRATGAELVTNGGFTGNTGWGYTGSGAYGSNNAVFTANNSTYANSMCQYVNHVFGKRYNLKYNIVSDATNGGEFQLAGTTFSAVNVNNVNKTIPKAIGINNFSFTSDKTATSPAYLAFWYNGGTSGVFTIDDVSLVQLGCILDLNAEGMSSATWIDKTNSLTATNSGTAYTCPPASNLKASYFNGSTSKVELTGMNGLAGILTISAQIRPLALGGYIFNNGKVKLYLNSSGYLTFSRDGTTYINSGAGSIAINTNYNVLVTSTATGVTNFYVNGVLSGTANQSAGTPASATSWTIGSNGTLFYNGTIKDMAINGEILDIDRISLLNSIQ